MEDQGTKDGTVTGSKADQKKIQPRDLFWRPKFVAILASSNRPLSVLLPKRKGRGLLRWGAARPAQVSGREEGVLRPALSGLEGVAGNRGARALLDEEPAAGRGTSRVAMRHEYPEDAEALEAWMTKLDLIV